MSNNQSLTNLSLDLLHVIPDVPESKLKILFLSCQLGKLALNASILALVMGEMPSSILDKGLQLLMDSIKFSGQCLTNVDILCIKCFFKSLFSLPQDLSFSFVGLNAGCKVA